MAWAQLPQGVHPVTWTHRLSAVRSFAAWLRTTDPAAEIPPAGVFPGQGKRPAPFIFSPGDITRLVSASANLRPAMRAATYTALFGLLAITGIRIGEALTLQASSIDLAARPLLLTPPTAPANAPRREWRWPPPPSPAGRPAMSYFAPALQESFPRRLVSPRAASPCTVAAYRDTFRLLLGFAAACAGKQPSALSLADLDAPLITAFLEHLQAARGNTARTRNARLAAIHSMFRYAPLRCPHHSELIQRVPAIPA